MKSFFADSGADYLDREVLRPLSHIHANWELTWDEESQKYCEEEDSFAHKLNELIEELENATPPAKYHDNEDRLAEYVRKHLNWNIKKVGKRWIGEDYAAIIEHGGFHDIDEKELVMAAAGRVHAAIRFGQQHYDEMEKSHRRMLAAVMSVILYHRLEPDK